MPIEVVAATLIQIALSGEQAIDGVSLAAGDRVLVKNQNDPKANGVFIVATAQWPRIQNAVPPVTLSPGSSVLVTGGVTQAGSSWILEAVSPIVPGVTPLVWRLDLSAYLTRTGTATVSGKTFAGEVQFQTDGERIGITSGDVTLTPLSATLHVANDRSAGVGILSQCYWEGSAAAPYLNNDTTLFETYNRTLSTSANRSWAASCSNAYHDVPAGVTDGGTRVGVIGWAVSATGREGYDHRGTIDTMHGVEGVSGFQGAGYAGAVINEAAGVRGLIYADNPGGVIQFARGGIFVSDGGSSRIIDNIGVYARARNGETDYSLYCDGGLLYNADKLLNVGQAAFRTSYSQSASAIAARVGGNSVEFGQPVGTGYGSNIGATTATGLPFLAFCAEAEPAGDAFRTRGRKGVVISSDLAGSLIFSRLTSANAGGQLAAESARFDDEGHLALKVTPILPRRTPATATAPGKVGEVSWDADYIYVCVATNTWKRTALASW